MEVTRTAKSNHKHPFVSYTLYHERGDSPLIPPRSHAPSPAAASVEVSGRYRPLQRETAVE
eukprot:158952-Rhodomonas_salina.2